MNERRRHPRVRLNAEFTAAMDGRLVFVEDLSQGGVFVRSTQLFEAGRDLDLRASLIADDIYILETRARIVGVDAKRRGLHLEFFRLSTEMSRLVATAIAFADARQKFERGDPRAIEAWKTLHAPRASGPIFDAKVLQQPSLLEPAAAADQRSLRQILQTRRARHSLDAAPRGLAAPRTNNNERQDPAAFSEPHDPLASPSAPPAREPAKAAHLSELESTSSTSSASRRIPGRAVASTHPRAKTAKPANHSSSRSTTLSVPLSVSEVEAWEAGLVPVADDEPPARPRTSASGNSSNRSIGPNAEASSSPSSGASTGARLGVSSPSRTAPRRDHRSEDEVTHVFALSSLEATGETKMASAASEARTPDHTTPLPAHLHLPSPEEDFI